MTRRLADHRSIPRESIILVQSRYWSPDHEFFVLDRIVVQQAATSRRCTNQGVNPSSVQLHSNIQVLLPTNQENALHPNLALTCTYVGILARHRRLLSDKRGQPLTISPNLAIMRVW